MPSPAAAAPLWDDAGTGGKRGSFWTVGGALGLLHAVDGHEQPKGPFPALHAELFQAAQGWTEQAPPPPFPVLTGQVSSFPPY